MPSKPRPCPPRRCLALAVLLALPALAPAAEDDAGAQCQIGVLKCPKKPVDWGMCGKNDLLDFYVPGLPVEGDRNSVERTMDALKVSSPDKSHYTLEGNAQIRQLDLFVHAQKITYDTETTDFTAEGPVTYQDRSLLMSATSARGNTDLDRCTLEGARYQLIQARGNGIAQVVVMDDPDHATLTAATYSTCNPGDQQWAFAAHELELDRAEGVGRGHGVTLRIHNVPVFWFPYIRFALDDRRESGFLYPDIGYSNRRGFDFALPYYFNLAPNYDATLTPRIMTDRGLMMGGEFRYLTDSSAGVFDAEYLAHDNGAAQERLDYGTPVPDQRWWYKFKDTTSLSPNWFATIDLNRVSDDRYFEDFGRGLYTTAISLLPSSAYLNGHGDWWTASIGGDSYQITDPTLPGSYEPYRRLPRATLNIDKPFGGLFEAELDSEFVAFDKDRGLTGQRIDLYPHLDMPIEAAGYFIRPEIGYRYTSYNLDDLQDSGNPLLTSKHPHRGVPIFSLDTGLVFERDLHFGDEEWTQTLEPRAYYLRVPYRNQDDLPVFDTQDVPFTFGQMFRSNSFVGADRQMDANNLTLAMTTRLLEDSTGTERVSASIGQIRYFNDQRVQLPGPNGQPLAPTDYSGSAYAGELDLHISDHWRLVLDQQWNPNSHQTDLSTVGLQTRFGDGGVVNFSYRFRRDFLEQVDLAAAIPIADGWRIVGRENYALNNPLALPGDPHGKGGRTLERFLGVEHETCCVTWRVLARHWIRDAEGNADDAIYFEMELKGLGSVGQKTDSFLRRAILGYQ